MSQSSGNNTGGGPIMGDVFKQRRANKKHQQNNSNNSRESSANNSNNNRQNNSSSKKSSLSVIQAEQEREQQQQSDNRGSGGGQPRFTNSRGGSNYNSQHNSNTGSDEEERKGGGGRRQQQPKQQQQQSRGGGGNRGGRTTSRHSSSNDRQAHVPLEQGVICTLREGFGFIHCADRPEQVFFHYSELRDGLRSTDLKTNDEVQFRIGEPPSPGGDKKDSSNSTKRSTSALHITKLPLGQSIVWEYPDETFHYPVRGLVERTARTSENSSRGTSGPVEGTIRLITATNAEKKDSNPTPLIADGPLIRYLADEYSANNKVTNAGASNNSDRIEVDGFKRAAHHHGGSSTRSPLSLSRGDLVEIASIVIDRRTKERYAKRISMIMSERQRHFQEIEAKLLAAATVEHGVVTAIKGDYGFLKSNKRHEEVYFHRSSITHTNVFDDDDDESNSNNAESNNRPALKEGQEMKFLVVTEGGDDDNNLRGQRRVSARQLQLQPAGSVQWHDVLAQGVTGEVIECPQPIDSGHPLETQGKIRLHTPIRMKKKHSLEEEMEQEQKLHIKQSMSSNDEDEEKADGTYTKDDDNEDDDYILCTEVYIWSKDSPGGNFSYRGGSSVGLYIQNGDTLLFDVIRDYIGEGGTCRAAPTKYLTPREEEQEAAHLEADNDIHYTDPSKAIRLIDLALAGRAEGVVNALKDNMYGFIHFAERPVDVHFKMYQLLPDDLQSDLRRNMGLPDTVKLEVGAEVQFDLSVHGTIASHSGKNAVGNVGIKKRQQQPQHIHERENLKAQRILLLPPGTIHQTAILAKGVTGKVCKQDNMQPYVGNVELDTPIRAMAPEELHPLVARMIETFLEDKHSTKIVYHDLQSLKEDEVVVKMVDTLGHGQLVCSHIPVPGETVYPGLLCIEKVYQEVSHTPDDVSGDEGGAVVSSEDNSHDLNNGHRSSDDDLGSCDELSVGGDLDANISNKNAKKKKKHTILKAKTLKTVRFDKTSLSAELRNDVPPAIHDKVVCDIVEHRRTGQSIVENMFMLQRHVPEVTSTGIEATGIVKDIMPNRDFGFISVMDGSGGSMFEMLSFQLSAVIVETNSNVKICKGDSVKFIIGMDTKNEKHVALNVRLITDNKIKSGSVANTTVKSLVSDLNPCKGIVLFKLAKNGFLKVDTEAPSAKKKEASAATAAAAPEKKSRWENVTKVDNKQEVNELGCILLTEDPNGLYNRKTTAMRSKVAVPDSGLTPSMVDDMTVSEVADKNCEQFKANGKEINDEKEGTGNNAMTMSAIKSHLHFKKSSFATLGGAGNADESTHPHRGDLVSFNKTRNNGVRDIRIVQRDAATVVQGHLKSINVEIGTAVFVVVEDHDLAASNGDKSETAASYPLDLKEIISCDVATLTEDETVEGILYDNQIFGVCRVSDLMNDTTTNKRNVHVPSSNIKSPGRDNNKSQQRPKLNLTVKKDRGGTIMAQSMMAKGPDGKTKGFSPGWTKRLSAFAPEFTVPGSGKKS